jgi:site-specific DNA-methyltransferase (cytosine-N4-specific)
MEQGYKSKKRPSEQDISDKFGHNNNGAIPPNLVDGRTEFDDDIGEAVVLPVNVIAASNTSSNDQYLRLCRENNIQPHPARFPRALPKFVIGLCTEEEDMVFDPFAGSNMTGYVAESMNRRWIVIEQNEEYLKGARFRFSTSGLTQPYSSVLLNEDELHDTPQQASLFELPTLTKRVIREEPFEHKYEIL